MDPPWPRPDLSDLPWPASSARVAAQPWRRWWRWGAGAGRPPEREREKACGGEDGGVKERERPGKGKTASVRDSMITGCAGGT